MNKVYTLRVVVHLFEQGEGDFAYEALQVRTQELAGDLSELQMMAGAVSPMAAGMTYAVIQAEYLRREAQEIPYRGIA